MKKKALIFLLTLLLVQVSDGQVVTQCKGVVNPSNKLWADYAQNTSQPAKLPYQIPLDINYPGLIKKVIEPNYTELKKAINELVTNKGGVISFKNVGAGKTIFFSEAIEISASPLKPCVTILIQGDNKVTFNGGGKSSIFVIRKSVKVIVQNAIFKNARLTKQIIQDKKNYRVGGGAIEITAGAALRVHGCNFLNNKVDEWDDTPGGAYDGVGENQNGAGIRFNYHSTGEVFNCTFQNCRAVTGGAIGATSINKLTVMDCIFNKNISTAYNTKHSTKRRVVEGAGAIRVDRTALPLEIYRSTFKENAANLKVSVLEVFIRPLRNNNKETGPYPDLSKFALIIDGCTFENNKYYNFQGANDPERGDFFSGCIVFHGGKLDQNFKGAKMKITNSKFIGNEVGESNVRSFLDFEITNSLFANTKILRLKNKSNVYYIGKGAIALRGEIPNKGIINKCTFYKNEPHPQDPQNQQIASDIFFWNGVQNKYTLSNSIFYRTNKNTNIKQVSQPMNGSGNNQFIPGVNMSLFSSVSKSSVNLTDPKISPNSIFNMCLGENSLPKGIGGLPDCDGNVVDGNDQLIANGTYFIESTTSNQRMFTDLTGQHKANMEEPKNSNSQKWIFNHLADDIYTIKNAGTIRFLEVPFAKCANKTDVATYTQVLGNHQKWKVVENGTGIYSLKPAHCLEQALDRNNGSLNTNVHTYTFGVNNNNQKWKIKSATLLKNDNIKNEESEIEIYPNPASELLTVRGIRGGDAIEVYDLLGKKIISFNVNNSAETIDLSSLNKGLYVVSIPGKKQIKLLMK